MNRDNSNYPPLANAWYTVFILMLAYAVSFIDRQILTLMVDPIRADLSITDTQFSLLHGLAFALFYAFMGIPIGRMADRHVRKRIIVIGVIFWSLMTAACGLATKFWHLFLARVGVGVGEAALSPPLFT
jgi:MFS family permease